MQQDQPAHQQHDQQQTPPPAPAPPTQGVQAHQAMSPMTPQPVPASDATGPAPVATPAPQPQATPASNAAARPASTTEPVSLPRIELPKFEPSFLTREAPEATHQQPQAAQAPAAAPRAAAPAEQQPSPQPVPQQVAVAAPVQDVVQTHLPAPTTASQAPAAAQPQQAQQPHAGQQAQQQKAEQSPADGKRTGRSATPEGYGPTATREDPSHQPAFTQADTERLELADAWQQASGSIVAETHGELVAPTASEQQQGTEPDRHMHVEGEQFPTPMVPPALDETPRPTAFAGATPLTSAQPTPDNSR